MSFFLQPFDSGRLTLASARTSSSEKLLIEIASDNSEILRLRRTLWRRDRWPG